MFEGEVQFVGAGSGICFLPNEGGGSTEGVDGAGTFILMSKFNNSKFF